MDKLSTCLWFDRNAEEAAHFYVGLFPDSSIGRVTAAPVDYPAGAAGEVLTVEFILFGRPFMGLNGGDHHRFTEAISLSIACDTQEEVDRYWSALSAVPESEQCGWLKDRFGLSWQIVPTILPELLADPNRDRAKRAMEAMLAMKKFDIAELKRATNG